MIADNISDEQLLMDIKLTQLEIQAYDNIQYGFLILSDLPENAEVMQKKYLKDHQEYQTLLSECENFLERLYEIKNERGL